jgi:hypothetical protein
VFELEDLECVLNKFKELPTRFRGAQERVPFRDLTAIRTDPLVRANRTRCGSDATQDLLDAFTHNGLECSVLCGAIPYGDDPCPALTDDMGMLMTGCYENQETHDPGFMIPRSPTPFGATIGAYPDPVAPQCPTATSSGSAVCVENCVDVLNGMSYAGGCWFAQLDTICMCGQAIYVIASAPELLGCNCCSQLPPVPQESSSSASTGSSSGEASSTSESSSSSSAAEPTDPCAQPFTYEGSLLAACAVGTSNWGMTDTVRHDNSTDATLDAYAACSGYLLPNACSSYATCGVHSDGCIYSVPRDGGDGFWYVTWWRCCFLA